MRIAIYTGEIPSTSFIENLIKGISEKPGFTVLIFGKKKAQVKYHSNVGVHYFPKSFLGTVFSLMLNASKLLVLRPFAVLGLVRDSFDRKKGFKYSLNRLVQRLIVVNYLPDVFHIQWIKEGDQWLFLQHFGVKVMASFRGTHVNCSPVADEALAMKYRKTFPVYDGFHSVSFALASEAEKYGVDIEKVFRIPSAVSRTLITEKKELKVYDSDSVLNILSIGRQNWIKGYHYALDACRILKDRGIKFKYLIVGGKPNEELLFQINDLDLKNEVEFVEKVAHDQIPGFYQKADLFLLPSVEEGIANVVLEAMAQEVPVVSTNCGGMAEVIKDGENGLLVPVRDPEAIANAVIQVVNNQVDLSAIVEAAKETIIKSHLLSGQINAFEKMYNEVLLIQK
ncbi:glycosyltransferase family 4 protein [Marinilabilia salmonicolor]|uniref:glycosyltransferase family 4 protein n=1 Tax=Marinilabilia salmonicolor TaxID=989 RepID=UPI00029A5911|nr:glycosyltransferase family 4 protein [Marinilabilia salmonicolor]